MHWVQGTMSLPEVLSLDPPTHWHHALVCASDGPTAGPAELRSVPRDCRS